MILVVGGIGSGKREYVRSLGFADADMSDDASDGCAVLLDAQGLVRDCSRDIAELSGQIAASKQVVVCQEVGSGIVPIAPDERVWRERAGTLAHALADRADAVVRMTCGIPQFLKGTASDAAYREEADGAIGFSAAPAHETLARAPIPSGATGCESGAKAPEAGASFFTNRACRYFPCHEGIAEEDFNCLFCYCPLYALGPDCGGNFSYTDKGNKNCKNCKIPHVRDTGAKLVAAHYPQLSQLARKGRAK